MQFSSSAQKRDDQIVDSIIGHLVQRRWWYRLHPFPHFIAYKVFSYTMYQKFEGALRELLQRGLSDTRSGDRAKFTRCMPYSDAYAWHFPPDIKGPFAIFYSRPWHDMLAALTGVDVTGDVNGALHHHQVGSKDGSIHQDISVGWFSTQRRSDGINPMDLSRCSYTSGHSALGVHVRETVRAVTMIYYFGNCPWQSGDGGETGLFESADAAITDTLVRVPPINNSLLLFENTPRAFHCFLKNRVHPRNSAILWLHQRKSKAITRWGGSHIAKW